MKINKLNRGEKAGLVAVLIFGAILAAAVAIGSEFKLFPKAPIAGQNPPRSGAM